ncbi:hypothetical protein ACFE04_025636 [Oxalis oulophora]
MSKPPPASISHDSVSSPNSQPKGSNGARDMDDPEKTMSTVARFIEQLHTNKSSAIEKELITARVLGIARARKQARALIGSHTHAIPLLLSILRSGTLMAKVNVTATLIVLCKDDELLLKVLLGGCIPPLLSLLKSDSNEARKAAAEAIYEVSSGGLSDDHVGMKIFVTEGVVPALWEQLNPKNRKDKVVEGFVTGALRNLCGDKDGYWKTTIEAGGVEIIVGLLSSTNTAAQANAASLLARLITAFSDSIPKVISSGAVTILLELVDQNNDISVRAGAADALEALCSESPEAKQSITDADGIKILTGAIVAPSKESTKGESSQALQSHATRALAHLLGGMSALVMYLAELSKSPRLSAPVADILGALAYALMVFQKNSGVADGSFNVTKVESILAGLLKPRDTKVIQDRILEAMASLYGNNHLSEQLEHAEAKMILVGLITLATGDVQEGLIQSFNRLCCNRVSVWEAIKMREGIQLLISYVGLSSELHQEYAIRLLGILTDQVDDSKWAITAAGGIPPLVQLLEMGSQKAREEAAHVLWNLCCFSEDMRACVESAGSVPAFLWLLKSSGQKGQKASSLALTKVVQSADPVTINQLLTLLLGESPKSKGHIIKVLGHVLAMASHEDILNKGSAANRGLRALIEVLSSSDKETKDSAASVLAELFKSRKDIADSLTTDDLLNPSMKLLSGNVDEVGKRLARALDALALSTKTKSSKKTPIGERDVKSLIKLAKTSSIGSAESAVAVLANLLSDPQVASEALAEDVVSALTRVLADGTPEGKKNASLAIHQLLKHFPVSNVLKGNAQCRFTVLALLDSLNAMDMCGTDAAFALEVVALLSRTKQGVSSTHRPSSALAEVPSSLTSLVYCIAEGPPVVQDKAIEILSSICGEQPVVLGDLLVKRPGSIGALGNRIVNSSSLEVKVGGSALLICATKEQKKSSMDALHQSGFEKPLLYSLVEMMKHNSTCSSLEIEVRAPRAFTEISHEGDEFDVPGPTDVFGSTVALWLLSIISSSNTKNLRTVVEAGGVEALSEKLAFYTSSSKEEYEDTEGIWITALLLAILFADQSAVSSPSTMRTIPSLALLLKSDEIMDRYCAAQAMANLVSKGNKTIILAIANSSAVADMISLIGLMESDLPNLVALAKEFDLVLDPGQVVLERLFQLEDVKVGPTAQKSIPLLLDILRPSPDRLAAPPFAVELLTHIADGSDANKLSMSEAGVLEALAKYLSLSPLDTTETTVAELIRILFSNPDVVQNESSLNSLNQLVAIMHLGSRSAKLSAAKAIDQLFDSESIRCSASAKQAVQPLVDMLITASESEQEAALIALNKLSGGDSSKAGLFTDVEEDRLSCLLVILSSATSSLEIKRYAAEFCFVLFSNPKFREHPIASDYIQPLIDLIHSDKTVLVESALWAFEKLLDNEQLAEVAAGYDIVDFLVSLISGDSYRLIEGSICCLLKLAKDRAQRKLDMVNSGVIDNCLGLLPAAPSSLCSSMAELFRILTNSGAIARSSDAAKIVEPLFSVLNRPDFSLWGQHSSLQTLVNILEKPQSLAALKLTPSQAIEPLISFLESPSEAIQQLGTELLTHLLAQEHFQQDITTKNAVGPLVKLAGIGILILQQTATKALEQISISWPKEVADAGGIFELSKAIIQDDPIPPAELWESATLVLCNILRSNSDYYLEVLPEALVRMLYSTVEDTVSLALDALIVHEKNDPSSVEQMAMTGGIDALLDLLRSHQLEEPSGRLLEALLNNAKVREMKVSRHAIAPLSQYLLDPQTTSESCRLLAALALGDLSQHEGLARVSDSVSACRALVSLLENKTSTEEIKMVSICALQNFVMYSRTNRRAVAEAGTINLIQELVQSTNQEIAGQAALLIRCMFCNHTLQEYMSTGIIKSLTAPLERDLSAGATINEEILRTLHVILTSFSKLHVSEATTLCIPHLVGALKSCREAAQACVLDTLCLLKHSWSNMPIDVAKNQAKAASEAILILQTIIKTYPPGFQERAEVLLHCLPGCLTVTILRGNDLKQTSGSPNAFCQLTIGNGPARQTKVVSHNNSPEWNEGFTWAFDVPPKGQKLNVICKTKTTFGKTTLGRVTIPIDKVVNEGVQNGVYGLINDKDKDKEKEKEKDGSSRTLEIEITWSNMT